MHISRVNCAEMAGDRPRQPANEIFSIECRFERSRSQSSTFNEASARGCQIWVPLNKVVIFALFACLAWKSLQIGTDVLLILTGTGNVLFSAINISDLKW